MKNILFISALVLPILFSGCSKDDNEEDEKISSQRKHIIIKETLYEYGQPSTYEVMEKQYYDEKGLLIRKETNYYSNIIKKRIPNYCTYKYDSKYRLIETKEPDERVELSYNDIDSVSEKKVYKDFGLYKHLIYKYDKTNKLIEVDELDPSSGLNYYHKLNYKGSIVNHRDTYDKDHKLWWTFDYEYDSHNNLIKTTNINPEDGSAQVVTLCEYTYNSDSTIKSYRFKWGSSTEMDHLETYTYNPDKTIKEIHIQYGSYDERHRIYEYINE